ncbi:MAG: glycosyl hydrolase [Pirellulaceae bacterium]
MDIVRIILRLTLGALLVGATIDCVVSQEADTGQTDRAGALAGEFTQPPESARPWVYWFWLNGNMTREGITADLEAMKRVGIGGVLIMEVDQGAPIGPIDFMSREWRDLFQHVQHESQRLGLEVNMNNDAGWNGSGGPWITPAQAMQKIVWSEIELEGPQRFEGAIPPPEKVADFYRDICVMAFPTPGAYRIDRIRAKAMFEIGGVGGIARDELPAEMRIDRAKIVSITEQVHSDGRIVWEVPAGKWTLVRFGHTCTGVENAPAPASGRGLECDKLSKEGIEANFAGMMAKLAADSQIGPHIAQSGLVATHIDSWENGSQNWTARMREEFQRRRGYDLFSFLPVVTGRVVDTLEVSERFLWDVRQTVSELVLENYAAHMRDLAHAHGMRFTVEAYGCPCDSLSFAGKSDEPMGEFWTPSGAIETCKTMASAAHVFGNKVVGAEAFTSGDQERWREHPALLKALGDQVFCQGINRFVFHRYAMQPWVEARLPGMTMGPWGQHYERTQTWWDWTVEWHTYLARCQHLLRQGLYVADICYIQPEAPPQGPRDYPRKGYDWDECPPDAVLTRMSVQDGRVVLPDGMSYRLLVLPDSQTMTPLLLEKIKQLVAAGATVLGPRPTMSPSLSNYPHCDEEIVRLSEELWGDCDGHRIKQHDFGQGHVLWGMTPEEALKAAGVPADFVSSLPLHHIHRRVETTDLYFVANPQPYELTATCSFRITGKTPEFWWPQSGRRENAAVFQEENGVTHVAVPLEQRGSVFIVFRTPCGTDDPIVELMHNGKPVVSATAAAPLQVVVTKARYGVLDDPQRTRDVTEKVQRKVDQGEYRFAVTSVAAGDDPAFGVVKTLAVDYTIEDQPFTVKAVDGAMIQLSANAFHVQIDKARYGVLSDPQRTRDVREKLQRLVDAGERSFRVARMADGDDPAFLVVKTLDLEFTWNGQRVHLIGTDPEVIDLIPPAALPPPAAIVRNGDEGTTQLEVREPGEYQSTRKSGSRHDVELTNLPAPVPVTGPWEVRFTPGWGVSSDMTFEQLVAWNEHTDPAVQHFSGTATYRKTLSIPSEVLKSQKCRLDLELGEVQVMARVTLNGQDLGTLWKPPFRVDITNIVKVGDNMLEIQVVNLWPNRMIGDEHLPEDSERHPNGTLKTWPQWLTAGQPSPTGRYTFTSWRLWKKEDALLRSGLLGPVTLHVTPCIPIP